MSLKSRLTRSIYLTVGKWCIDQLPDRAVIAVSPRDGMMLAAGIEFKIVMAEVEAIMEDAERTYEGS